MIRKMKEMGYQKGTSHAKAGYHWTQENGSEIVARKSDGAMLVPLGEGDMVFNNESTKRLFEKALFASVNHAMTGKGTALDKLKYIKH